MKHLLKPTGQILTTAVFTSTAIDAYFPLVATPVPLDSMSPETEAKPEAPTIDATAIANQSETIAPPELESDHQSLSTEEWSLLPEESFSIASIPETTNDGTTATSASVATTETSETLDEKIATGNEAQTEEFQAIEEIPSFAIPTVEVFLPEAAAVDSNPPTPPLTIDSASHTSPQQDSPSSQLVPGESNALPEQTTGSELVPEFSQPLPASGSAGLDSGLEQPDSATPAETMAPTHDSSGNGESAESNSQVGGEISNTNSATTPPVSPQTVEETRDWLDEQLAIIVNQARDRQAYQDRQRLIDYARESIEVGNLEEARNIANNPILTVDEQEALAVAIAEAAEVKATAQSFIPLVPLNEDLDLIAIQSPSVSTVNTSTPLEDLPVLPTTPLDAPDSLLSAPKSGTVPHQLPLVPLATSGLHQWPTLAAVPGSTARAGVAGELPPPSSPTAAELQRCWFGQKPGDDIEQITALANDNLFSDHDNDSNLISSNLAMAYIGTGQQPPSVVTTNDQFPVGGKFLEGVGQQPPSVLADSSWSSALSPSTVPRPFRWTQERLDLELEAMAAATSTAPSPECQELLAASSNIDNSGIGGRTVASLTGYEWLSQFAFSSESERYQNQPIYMILPLPTQAPLTSKFGWRIHPIHGGRRFHFGIDYGAPKGTPILASIPGRVETTGALDGYGLTVIIENEELGLRTLYAHMSGIGVQRGAEVAQGAVLGWVGSTGNSTGPHLHFEVHRRTAEGWVAMDPLQVAADLVSANQSE